MTDLDARADAQINREEDGAVVLDDVAAFIGRFVSYPSEYARVAHALWLAHTHAMDAWVSTPRISFLSPEPGSGKTRALEISELLVPRPVAAVNVTPAYLFRKISDPSGPPTLLYDEIDTVFGPNAKNNEDLRGLLNAGHRRGAIVGRCGGTGGALFPQELPAYCAVALAGLGNLPDTILSRSVVVRMRRRAPTESVEPYRHRLHADVGHSLRDRLGNWIVRVSPILADARPDMPAGVEDRNADVWEPLLAIADAAGRSWPAMARAAAVSLVMQMRDASPSLGVRLLEDIRAVFADRLAMKTEDLLSALCDLPESPWANMRGQAIDARRLAGYLKQYGVQPKPIRFPYGLARGYAREDLHDPWSRYLSPLTAPCQGHVPAVTAVTVDAFESSDLPVTAVTDVTERSMEEGAAPRSVPTCRSCGGEGCHWCSPGGGREPPGVPWGAAG